MDFIVRPAILDDLEGIRTAHMDSIRRIASAYYPPEAIAVWADDRSVVRYREAIESGEVYFVAEMCGSILGFSSYKYEGGRHVLKMLYVRGNAARQGIGTALLNTIENYVLEKGAQEIFLQGSLAAEAFYLHHGYVQIRKYKYEMHGVLADCFDMKKNLKAL